MSGMNASRITLISLAALAAGLASGQAFGQSRVLADPPLLQERGPENEGLEAVESRDGEAVLDLRIQYTSGKIYNPATRKYDSVKLRSYVGTGVEPDAPFVSPTIIVKPGDTVRVNLDNRLPADPSCSAGDQAAPDVPHCFNGTNLHTHGLWVNPSGNGDNVLLSINPGHKFEYEYNIPSTHPAGTFWYHTHRHGSTALQVSSGMAGALIIKGDRLPTLDRPGDLDRLLAGFPDRTLVMQQIQYACRDANGKVKTDKNGYHCAKEDVGGVESYDLFGPRKWEQSGRYTSINGLVLPVIQAVQGQVERWRGIHAGVRDTISLTFVKADSSKSLKLLSQASGPAAMEELIGKTCTGARLQYHLVAADGLTLGKALKVDQAVYQPGYRFDSLVVFPEAGTYCMIDAAVGGSGSVGGEDLGPRLLGVVTVAAGQSVGPDIGRYVTDKLVASAASTMRGSPVAAAVTDELRTGLQLSHFVAHKTVAPSEVTGTQELTFLIEKQGGKFNFEVGSQDYAPRPYVADRVDRKLTLGGVDEWNLRSAFDSHPFHIHVNPFQIVEVLDPWGRDVSDPANADTYPKKPGTKDATVDVQYAGLKNAWKDTLWLKSNLPADDNPAGTDGIYKIKVRTRYERYIGEFVLHCHILDHEDQGMMQNVAIVLPGNGPAAVNAGTGGHGGH
jgi:FtsP/CotA-like multicopper oxidase with cupredoxin domain